MLFNPLPNRNDRTFSFPFQCIMLKFNGAWPLNQSDQLNLSGHLYLVWSYIMIVLIALTCAAQATFLIAAWGNILVFTECGCTVFMGIHNLLRLIHLSVKRKALKKLIANFVRHIWIARSTDEGISNKCEREMILLSIISALQFVLIWMYILLPLLELYNDKNPESKPFPYKMIFPYDADHSWQYGVTYFLTSLAGFGVVTTLFSEDSIFAFFTTYACGQFYLLHKRIDDIMIDGQSAIIDKYLKNADNSVHRREKILIQYKYRQIFVDIVRDHNVLIDFHQQLQDFFSPILLVNYIISSLLICMVGLQIVAVKLTIGDFLKLVVYIVSALSQLFILCWKGDMLMDLSSYTGNVFYSCNWQGKPTIIYEKYIDPMHRKHLVDCPSDVHFMKNLKFAIARSQIPLMLRAMKFSALAMLTFSRILSTSMSYFTLLQTMVARNELSN